MGRRGLRKAEQVGYSSVGNFLFCFFWSLFCWCHTHTQPNMDNNEISFLEKNVQKQTEIKIRRLQFDTKATRRFLGDKLWITILFFI
jgi:hypothetical protein